MTTSLTLTARIQRRHRRQREDALPPTPHPLPAGRVPRIARLMALAIRLEQLLDSGTVADAATLARLGHVSRARITQILNLRLLAPDLQEALLFWPRIAHGREPLVLRDLQPLAAVLDWAEQRRWWHERCLKASGKNSPQTRKTSRQALELVAVTR